MKRKNLTKSHSEMEIEECVITKIRERRDAGRKKYGITMERDDLSILEWITHAQEEALDFAIYLEKLKRLHMKTDDQINQELTLSTSDQHKELVHRLKKEPNDIIRNNYTVDVQHMLIGLFGEVGELSDCVKKHTVYGQDLDYGNLLEELGDIEFYLQGLREIFRIDREEVLRQNIEKLNKRYSSGKYSDQEARDRADKTSHNEPLNP